MVFVTGICQWPILVTFNGYFALTLQLELMELADTILSVAFMVAFFAGVCWWHLSLAFVHGVCQCRFLVAFVVGVYPWC